MCDQILSKCGENDITYNKYESFLYLQTELQFYEKYN